MIENTEHLKRDSKGRFVEGGHSSTEFKKDCLSSKQGKTYEEIYGEEKADKIKEKSSKSHQGMNTKENHPRWKGGIPEMICEGCGKIFKPKRRASKIQRFCSTKCKGEHFRGEKHWSFKDGGESLYCFKFNFEFKERVRDFFGRCCYLCNKNEEDNGRRLDVHHVN
ncbi:MAG: hypothetical protein GPJ50_03355 [Candidatus Heimdallarchaeota archaeon]|nr:hypothetical protein [Candidatus Heimdallarchaeota archaeon]